MSNTTKLLAIALGIYLAQQDRKVAKEAAEKKPKKITIEIEVK